MNTLVFRIRQRYYDQIVAGTKTVEYRRDVPFWQVRIGNIDTKDAIRFANAIVFNDPTEVTAVFICGKRSHRRQVTRIERIKTPDYSSEQGKKDVNTPACFGFHLGLEVKP